MQLRSGCIACTTPLYTAPVCFIQHHFCYTTNAPVSQFTSCVEGNCRLTRIEQTVIVSRLYLSKIRGRPFWQLASWSLWEFGGLTVWALVLQHAQSVSGHTTYTTAGRVHPRSRVWLFRATLFGIVSQYADPRSTLTAAYRTVLFWLPRKCFKC